MVCLPTGSGKTVIFSRLAALARRPVLVLAHREELLAQARARIEAALAGTATVAIEQASQRAPADAKVVVASLRSLRNRRLQRLRSSHDFGLIVYDECHHAAAEDNLRILRELGAFEPDWDGTLLGFTATTRRGDGQGLDHVFEQIVYSRSLQEMISDGYLAPLRGFRIATAADLSQLSGMGDFALEELAEAVDIEDRNALVARSLQELARDRRSLVFCVTVRHARNLARALNHVGVRTGVMHGGLKAEVRARLLADFRNERLQALTNIGVLTEGFDDPGVSCVAMARPTRSQGLYAQCVGRGTRLFPGKRDCLILDFVDASRLPLATLPSLFGMPFGLQLGGADVAEAASEYRHILAAAPPGFEVEPGEITLADIKRRAENFDPLAGRPSGEVLAISPHAWVSLGRKGLALHFLHRRQLCCVTVLETGHRGRRRYQVRWDGAPRADFSYLEEAVEACDYELRKLGRKVIQSALEAAPWRCEPIDAGLQRKLAALPGKRSVQGRAEALRLLLLAEHC